MTDADTLTTSSGARVLGVSEATVRKLADDGVLPVVRTATGVELTAAERRNLMPRDFEQIDLMALERGVSRLTAGEIPNKPTLILQLSFATLGNGRARVPLLERARQVQHILRQAAICELVDVEPGVPTGRLEEVTLLLRGFFRAVWVEVEPNRQILESAAVANVCS